jgi:NAD(P)-dependent dehydrogenase (short-subunit alcohol dehydrogenase family)
MIQHLVTTVALELGGIDILVNHAVNSVPGTFLELSDETCMNHINVNIIGYVRSAHEVIPHMTRRWWAYHQHRRDGGTSGRTSHH